MIISVFSNLRTMKLTCIFFIAFLLISCCTTQKTFQKTDDLLEDNRNGNSSQLKDLSSNSNEYLMLEPSIQKIDYENIKFILKVTRLKTKEDEYIPTSESLRIVVSNVKGKTIWESNKNMNYLQVISPLLPENKEEIYTYELDWNGKDNEGNELSNGSEYTAIFLIPSEPESYSTSLKFIWKKDE